MYIAWIVLFCIMYIKLSRFDMVSGIVVYIYKMCYKMFLVCFC